MKDIFTSSGANIRKNHLRGGLIVIALILCGTRFASADFISEALTRGVDLSVEVDGDINSNPAFNVSSNAAGLFDPANQSISETSLERGNASANIDHQSDIVFSADAVSISVSNSGSGSSTPADGYRGTLNATSELRVRFSSDVPFTFTLTSTSLTHSSGSPGNTASFVVPYGVTLHDAVTDTVYASYTLANPTGSTTLTLPAGSYFLDSISGVSFDAIFGDPPAANYSSDFNSVWSFTAAPLPDPSIAKRAECARLDAALKRAKAVFKKAKTKRNQAKVKVVTKALNRCRAELAALL